PRAPSARNGVRCPWRCGSPRNPVATIGLCAHSSRRDRPASSLSRSAISRPRSRSACLERSDLVSQRTAPHLPLDNKSCQGYPWSMLDLEVIDDPAAATVALEPMRSRLLSELKEPASAAALATRVGLTRQKVNYHLRALEEHGLVRLAEERAWGGLRERLLVATASSYVVSPGALGPA